MLKTTPVRRVPLRTPESVLAAEIQKISKRGSIGFGPGEFGGIMVAALGLVLAGPALAASAHQTPDPSKNFVADWLQENDNPGFTLAANVTPAFTLLAQTDSSGFLNHYLSDQSDSPSTESTDANAPLLRPALSRTDSNSDTPIVEPKTSGLAFLAVAFSNHTRGRLTTTDKAGCKVGYDWARGRLRASPKAFLNEALDAGFSLRLSCIDTGHDEKVHGSNARSLHKLGLAFDIDQINGEKVRPNGRQTIAFLAWLNSRSNSELPFEVAYYANIDLGNRTKAVRAETKGVSGGPFIKLDNHKNHVHLGFKDMYGSYYVRTLAPAAPHEDVPPHSVPPVAPVVPVQPQPDPVQALIPSGVDASAFEDIVDTSTDQVLSGIDSVSVASAAPIIPDAITGAIANGNSSPEAIAPTVATNEDIVSFLDTSGDAVSVPDTSGPVTTDPVPSTDTPSSPPEVSLTPVDPGLTPPITDPSAPSDTATTPPETAVDPNAVVDAPPVIPVLPETQPTVDVAPKVPDAPQDPTPAPPAQDPTPPVAPSKPPAPAPADPPPAPGNSGRGDSDKQSKTVQKLISQIPQADVDFFHSTTEPRLAANGDVYARVAAKTGVNKCLLMAAHWREGGARPDASSLAGERIGTPNPDHPEIVTASLEDSLIHTAGYLKGLAKMAYDVDVTSSLNLRELADIGVAYNRGNIYKNHDIDVFDSPYAVNGLDSEHEHMVWPNGDPIATMHPGQHDGDRLGFVTVYLLAGGPVN